MLARMETYMPVKPARPEQMAPTRKLMTVLRRRRGCGREVVAEEDDDGEHHGDDADGRYWRERKASAPSRMASEMTCMSAVPVSPARTIGRGRRRR
jgi:hypothetical protein